MKLNIAVLAGDGIGPEVMDASLVVLNKVCKLFNHQIELNHGLIGGAAYDEYGKHFPEETANICSASNAILFGSVGGPVESASEEKWKGCEANSLLALRKEYSFYANLRPAKVYSGLIELSPLKDRVVSKGVDLLICRELLGDLYFGKHETKLVGQTRTASDIAEYTEEQIAKIAHVAFQSATKRRRSVVSVDKANVLDTSKLWRAVVSEVHKDYPGIELSNMLVDNCAMQLVANPSQFDVIVTSNMFGDILSDTASMIPGSLGLMPSASLSESGFAMYEPSGGSAQDIAGKGIANPVAQILSAAMMLRYSFRLNDEASCIEKAVDAALESGVKTSDLCVSAEDKSVSTVEFANSVASNLCIS